MIYPIKIKKKIQETSDSVSFIFSISQEHQKLFHYVTAQFLTFQFEIEGKKFLRSYSLSSCPLLEEELKTTVKRVDGGLISNYMLDYLKEGDTLLSRKPAGRFFRAPKDLKPKHYFLFAGGSGITPMFSIIKTVLLIDSENKVTLFYSNRNESSIIYQKELKTWLEKYRTQFNQINILSQPQGSNCDIKGRLKKKHLETYFKDIDLKNPDHLYYSCGPLGFMQTVKDFLLKNQVNKIYEESFLSASQKKEVSKELVKKSKQTEPAPEVRLKALKENEEAPPQTIRASIGEDKIEIPAKSDIPILEQLLSAGHSPPFSCLAGNCMSCLAHLKRGQIRQEELGILEDENLENHEILTCQAIPESRVVEVDYENL